MHFISAAPGIAEIAQHAAEVDVLQPSLRSIAACDAL